MREGFKDFEFVLTREGSACIRTEKRKFDSCVLKAIMYLAPHAMHFMRHEFPFPLFLPVQNGELA